MSGRPPADGMDGEPDTSSAEAALRARLSRKRTKTGCLTCRRRRIKCGEERPVCKNCIKSKRSCEGYNQRVIFKPGFDIRNFAPGGAHITFQTGPVQANAPPWPPSYDQTGGQQQHGFAGYSPALQDGQFQQAPVQYNPPAQYPPPPVNEASGPVYLQQHPNPAVGFQQHQFHFTPAGDQGQHIPAQSNAVREQWAHVAPQVPVQHFHDQQHPYTVHDGRDFTNAHAASDYKPVLNTHTSFPNTVHHGISPVSIASPHTMVGTQASTTDSVSPVWAANGYTPRPELSRPIDYPPPAMPVMAMPTADHPLPMSRAMYHDEQSTDLFDQQRFGEPITSPTQFLREAAVETHDNDYYDVNSDEDRQSDESLLAFGRLNGHHAFQSILTTSRLSINDPQRRRFDTFLYPGILDRYRPDDAANPLGNEATARLFLHFVAVTGPCLSVYERQVRNTSMLFTEGPVEFSQQGLWTYTMPQAALRNRGLLHAMLALASLQVARLTNASETPSIQHYAWALKRINHMVGNEATRYKVTTIAASLLLGFYEIWTADHVKWNWHLAGSKQLFLETDFKSMTRHFRRLKIEREERRRDRRRFSLSPGDRARDEMLDQIHDVDERTISAISGQEVRYDTYGEIGSPTTIPKQLDLSRFEVLKDLYWWYLKQDVYQSIVSGNPLLLEYSRWTDCPPRSPLGKPDAVYGTFDHLILLLGRIADFSARDRRRKLKIMKHNGGNWIPNGAGIPGPGQTSEAFPAPGPSARKQGQSSGPPAGPAFFGMAPAPRSDGEMPSAYSKVNGLPTPEAPSPQDSSNLFAESQAALAEYGRIRAALHSFSANLGEPFKPLNAEFQPPLDTPFGTALFYRSYDIGVLWAIYHMAIIIAIRNQPHAHPAAHVSAGFYAGETHFFAKEIGRIVAGIVPGPPDQPLNPTLGSALTESCMPSFFAAIQYQDDEQRRHTVLRIKSIAQRTGWGSAELIANGCETAWVKAAEAGRGPPYTRVARREQADDPRLNGTWERLDQYRAPNGRDEPVRNVPTQANARLNWAVGIMGTEHDEMVVSQRWD